MSTTECQAVQAATDASAPDWHDLCWLLVHAEDYLEQVPTGADEDCTAINLARYALHIAFCTLHAFYQSPEDTERAFLQSVLATGAFAIKPAGAPKGSEPDWSKLLETIYDAGVYLGILHDEPVEESAETFAACAALQVAHDTLETFLESDRKSEKAQLAFLTGVRHAGVWHHTQTSRPHSAVSACFDRLGASIPEEISGLR